jgi:TonB family protein
MKRCTACEHEFENTFSFCPIDGMPLIAPASAAAGGALAGFTREYRVTIVDGAGLLSRLRLEVSFVRSLVRVAWPEFKRDPIGFAARWAIDSAHTLRRSFGREVLAGTLGGLLIVLSAIGIVFVLEKNRPSSRDLSNGHEDLAQIEIIPLSPLEQISSSFDLGIGVGSRGRVGFATGRGEGSNPEPKKPSGGGGSGGLQELLPPQQGRIPQPSEIPAPIPKLSTRTNPALPLAGIDLDPALWKALPFPNYGDPKSKATTPSNGPGTGGGMGNGDGQGIGKDGNGPGVGPGDGGNIGGGPKLVGGNGPSGSSGTSDDPSRVYPPREVSQRAQIISKPEPQYTEAARRNQTTGTVVLSVVFSKSGEVTNIRVIQSLPDGITEKAIAAARAIRFVPALKNNNSVSVYMQLEYNFNLY